MDHLAGKSGNTHELLAELTPEQRDEQIAYYEHLSATAETTGDGVYRSASYARYRHRMHAEMARSSGPLPQR